MKKTPEILVEIVPIERKDFIRFCQIVGEEIADQQWAKAHKKRAPSAKPRNPIMSLNK